MRYILILLLIPLLTYAAELKNAKVADSVYCFKLKELTKELKEDYGEEPMFYGKSSLEKDVFTVIFVNQASGSYTIIGADKESGCVFDSGVNMHYRMPKMLDKLTM